MTKKIPLSRPFVDEKEALAAKKVVLSGWLTQGPKVREFEALFAKAVGTRYACATSSGTTALHLALLAVGVKPGDAVITVSHSFIASANSVRHCGAEPLFVDVSAQDLNMDLAALQNFLKKDCKSRGGKLVDKKNRRVAAILAVHQIGLPCDIESIARLAKKFKLPVVEDAACAIGSELYSRSSKKWERIGKPHADIACFSFHPRKVLTTGDGGMITTNNKTFDRICRLRRVHGMDVSSDVRHKTNVLVQEKYLVTGFNYRLTDIQAAVGTEQLKKLNHILRKRSGLAKEYKRKLKNIPWLRVIEGRPLTKPNWQSFAVLLLPGAPLKQIPLLRYLLRHGIAAKAGIQNAHEEAPYKNLGWKLKLSESLRKNCVLLPFYAQLSKSDLHAVCKALQNADKA